MCEENSETAEMSEHSEDVEIIPGYSSIEPFTKDGYKILMDAIKHSNALPSSRDWSFYNTSDSFKRIVNDESRNVSLLMNSVMRLNEIDSNIINRILDEKIELIIEANDVILEKVANNIDELNGVRTVTAPPVVLQTVSAQLPVNGSWNRPNAATFSVNSHASGERNCIKLLTGKNIVRPQKFFKDKIDNRNNVPWHPRITEKPNSLKPLAMFLEECEDRQEFSHPYEYELDLFAPTASQLVGEKPTLPKPVLDTPLIEITKPDQLDDLVETLRSCKEFAVDVEHHSYRSFMGITCLLQISTQDKDYLIDALALRDKLDILNEVFAKNTIVKIFHGADRDIEWLQRDLSIYVVNMFDTHQAAKMLEYQALSLAFLMKKFCNVLPNKEYQLADWRIRPLPEELKNYAREDTHYLIYIYKMLKKELLLRGNKCDNLLKSVIERGTEICRKRYFKPVLHDDSHLGIYIKCKKMFDNRQMYALKEIFAWRDHLAREEDESLGYVLPNHMLLQISETLPREMQGILASCNPVPPLVRSHLLSLHHIILKAREQPLEKAITRDTTGRGVVKTVSKINVDSALHCPHDLSKASEFRDDLPTLLQNIHIQPDLRKLANAELSIEKSSNSSIFGDSDDDRFTERQTFKKVHGFAYLSPFERYKLVRPFVIAEDEAKKEQEVKIEETKSQEEETNLERTDEERIASIKDHFVQLSKKFSEELQAQKQQEENEAEEERCREQQSLLQMGGSRKRKRDFFEPQQGISNNFDSPIPNPNTYFRPKLTPTQKRKIRKSKGQKRKFDETYDDNNQTQEFGDTGKKQKLKQKQQNNQQWTKKQKQQNSQQQMQNNQQQNQQFQQQKKNQNKQRPNTRNKQQTNIQNNQQPNMQNNQHQPVRKAMKNKKPKNQNVNLQKKGKTQQNPQNQHIHFSPYDYASVDFRQFEGGAGSANTGAQVKQNFKQKNRKQKSKRGAKSATFTNTRQGQQNKNY